MKINIRYSCSDYCHHQHRWKWTAWVCGRFQKWFTKPHEKIDHSEDVRHYAESCIATGISLLQACDGLKAIFYYPKQKVHEEHCKIVLAKYTEMRKQGWGC